MFTSSTIALMETLQRNRQFNHAYLIEGGSESRDLAQSIAQIIFCEKDHPCNCSTCSRVQNNTFSELMIITPGATGILNESIIEIQKFALLKPIYSDHKVIIIHEADRMNITASAKLLKILEEPPEYITFILTVKNIKSLLDTIRSRCEIISLPKLHPQHIVALIQKNCDINDADAEYCCCVSCFDAERSLELCKFPEILNRAHELSSNLKNNEFEKRIALCNEVFSSDLESIKNSIGDITDSQLESSEAFCSHIEKCFYQYLPIRREIYFSLFQTLVTDNFSYKLRLIENIFNCWKLYESSFSQLLKKYVTKINSVASEKSFLMFGKILIQKEIAYFVDILSYFCRDLLICGFDTHKISQFDKIDVYIDLSSYRGNSWKIFKKLLLVKKDIFTNVDTLGSLESLILE